MALVEQFERLVTDGFPVLGERLELGKLADVDVRLVRHRREHVHQRVVRRHERRMIGELAIEPMPDAAAQMHVHHRREEHVENEELRREPVDGGELSEHSAIF